MSGQSIRERQSAQALMKIIKDSKQKGFTDQHTAESVQRVLSAHIASDIEPFSVLQNFGSAQSPLRVAIEQDLPLTFTTLFVHCYLEEVIGSCIEKKHAVDNLRENTMQTFHSAADFLELINNITDDLSKWNKPVSMLNNQSWLEFFNKIVSEQHLYRKMQDSASTDDGASTPEALLFSKAGGQEGLQVEPSGSKPVRPVVGM